MLQVADLAKMIDHSIIDPNATEADMHDGIDLAVKYQVGQFVTTPFRVKSAKKLLEGTGIALQTPISYPHGNDTTDGKVSQATRALDDGVDELDMVINFSAMLSGDVGYVENEVRAVVEAARPYGVIVKAIIEVSFLSREQQLTAAKAAEAAGAGFIKTSTGTRPDQQATVAADVRALRQALRPETVIKASGGVFSLDAVLLYYDAGARRFGASETANILEDLRRRIETQDPAAALNRPDSVHR